MRYAIAALAAALALVGASPLAPACPPEKAAALVDDAYLRFLHRLPDPAGRDNYIRHLRCGMSVARFHAEILGGPEYYELRGGTPPAFVAGLYEDILGRAPSAEEIDGWLTPRYLRQPRNRLAEDFLRSARRELAGRPPIVLQGAPPDPALAGLTPAVPGVPPPDGPAVSPHLLGSPLPGSGPSVPEPLTASQSTRSRQPVRPLAQLLQRNRPSPRP